MQIPQTIQLLGRTITTLPGTKKMGNKGTMGLASYTRGIIHVSPTVWGKKVPKDMQEQVFFHELIHQCLDAMGKYKLSKNERFVDGLGCLLHQALGPHMK